MRRHRSSNHRHSGSAGPLWLVTKANLRTNSMIRRRTLSASTASGSRDAHRSTSSGYMTRYRRRGDRNESCCDDIHGGGGAGKQLGCKRLAEDHKGKVGKLAGSNGSGDHSSGSSGSESNPTILSGSTGESFAALRARPERNPRAALTVPPKNHRI